MTTGGDLLRASAASAVDRLLGARRDVRSHFLHAGAMSAERAVEYAPPDGRRAREFRRMADAGLVRRAYGRLHYLDEAASLEAREGRTRRAVPWVIAGCVAIALFATRFYVDASRSLP